GRAGLARLLLEHLAHVADPLLLVGIGPAQLADLRRDLPHLLPVDPGDGDARLLVHGDLDAFGDAILDRVREAEREHDLVALDLRAIADADDVEVLAEALGHALDRVLRERARHAVEGPHLALVVHALAGELGPLELERDARGHRGLELALRALHLEGGLSDLDLHLLGHRDDLASYARHGDALLTRRCRGSRRPRPRGPRCARS